MCDHRPDDGESLLKSLVERCVLGVHHDIRARLHIGHPGGVVETDGMEVVSAGSPVDTMSPPTSSWAPRSKDIASATRSFASLRSLTICRCPHIPSRPKRKARVAVRRQRVVQRDQAAPQRGIPTSTSMMMSPTPAMSRFDGFNRVNCNSCNHTCRFRCSRHLGEAINVQHRVRKQEIISDASSDHSNDLSRRCAGERTMPMCDLLCSERGAFMRLHVWSQ